MEAVMSKDKLDSPSENDTKLLDQSIDEGSSASTKDLENNAENSSDSDASQPDNRTTLDLVKEALKSDSEGDDKTEGNQDKVSAKDDESKDKSEIEEDDSEESEEELKAWKEKLKAETRERFEKLQKRDFQKKQKIVSLEGKLKEVEADATFKHQYDNFCTTNGITEEEANTLFDIGALMKNNPAKALEMLTPYYNQLLQVTGNVLPPDLAQQVKDGYINEPHAYEISRLRAVHHHNTVMTQNRTVQQQQATVQDQQKLSTDIQGALANLESNWQKSDPDYKLKNSRIQDRMKLTWFEMSQKGQMPRSTDEAVQIAEKVKKEVERELRQFVPKKAVNTVEGGGSVTQMKAEPKSTLDIIRQARGS